ncbi:MAG: VCBS repeat-containing protein, partial [Mariprofundaceae bacterium]
MHNIGPQRVAESREVHFTDLNQDGNLDLLIGGRGLVDGFHVEWGDGEGHWRMQGGPLTSMHPRAFAVADVDMDDRLEVLSGGDGDQKGLQVWKLSDDS